MPIATLGAANADPLLTDFAISAIQADTNFAHGRVFAPVAVSSQSARYFRWNLQDIMRDDVTGRRPGGPHARVRVGFSQQTAVLEEDAGEYPVPDEIRNSQDGPFAGGMRAAITQLAHKLSIRREVQFVARYVVPGGATPWANADLTPTAAWNTAAAVPIADVRRWARTIHLRTGYRPNVLILSRAAFDAAVDAVQVVGRLPDNALRNVTQDILAALFELDEVVVADAVRETAPESAATAAPAFIWPAANALLAYRSRTPSLDEPSAGYIFTWTEFDNVRQSLDGTLAPAIRVYDEPQTRSLVAQASIYHAQVITAPEAGVRIATLVT